MSRVMIFKEVVTAFSATVSSGWLAIWHKALNTIHTANQHSLVGAIGDG
ncbi:MAG: hypothetical protein J2P31_00715 [Blastocatellia bacterium]|nr:hypothetical protein [Blastocatellia bacterium]